VKESSLKQTSPPAQLLLYQRMMLRAPCRLLLASAAAVAVAVWLAPRADAHKPESQATWTTDISPIVERRCASCHSKNGFAPMPLVTYDQARAWAKPMRDAVLERRMPPWPAAKGFGDFVNDRSLTEVEIELLTSWVTGGMPVGPAAVAAAPAADPQPDLVLTMPERAQVSGSRARYRLATSSTEDRWIDAWEFKPGNRSLVQEAIIWIAPQTLVGRWTPGGGVVRYPHGVGQRLPRGAEVLLDVVYRKTVDDATDQSGVALYFGSARKQLRHRTMDCGRTVITSDIDIVALTPRSPGGESIELVVRHRTGAVQPMAVVPSFQPEYPLTYRPRVGIRLRRGDSVEVRSTAASCSTDVEYVTATAGSPPLS